MKGIMSNPQTTIAVKKSKNEELKQVLYVVMAPDETDLHGDTTSPEEISKACHNFNLHCRQANLFHLVQTDSFSIVESYIAPVDFVLNEKVVKAGTWLSNLQIHDDQLWELIKSGDITGVSINALASVETLQEETND